MSNGRCWTSDDLAHLRRLVASGRTDTQIGVDMVRHRDVIRQKRNELDLRPGQSPIFTAMMARINTRRMMRRVARAL